jgi:PAS domain S-box-containing protein
LPDDEFDNRTQWLASIVESSEDAIISRDLSGVIVTWNHGAQRLFGFTPQEAVGRAITIIVPPDLHQEETRLLDRLGRGEHIGHYETVRVRKDGTVLDVSLSISPIRDSSGRVAGASSVARDITERKRAERALRSSEKRLHAVVESTPEYATGAAAALLLELQDEERRRIARELHDGVGQHLVALSLNAGMILREAAALSPEGAQRAMESQELIGEVLKEIRTMSYLLHPPLLDQAGLDSALKWYVEGFSERSRIAVKLDLPGDPERLPREHELCLFRIAQECLVNIHRHSGSITARVRLSRTIEETTMEVSDDGRGIPHGDESKIGSVPNAGVGLRGMRERVRQLGGSFEIHSNREGTRVTATLPLGRSEKGKT